MIVEFEWKSGLVFGIESDILHEVPEVNEKPDFENSVEHSVIYLHLGILTVCLIF